MSMKVISRVDELKQKKAKLELELSEIDEALDYISTLSVYQQDAIRLHDAFSLLITRNSEDAFYYEVNASGDHAWYGHEHQRWLRAEEFLRRCDIAVKDAVSLANVIKGV